MRRILRYEDFCDLDTVLTGLCVLLLTVLPCLPQEPAVCTDWFVVLLHYGLHVAQLTFLITWQWLVLGLKRLPEIV
jgi:hypothetical protein